MSAAAPLVFSWASPGKRVGTLILFLIASALLHAFCFYLFQIVYPPTVALPPAPARLSVISHDDPESLALLRWVEAEDPALASTTQRAPDGKSFVPPKLQHVPSYTSHRPVLKTLPEPAPDLNIPSAARLGPVRVPSLNANVIPPSTTRKTSVLFGEVTAELVDLPEFSFHASRPDAPANARFRIAIDPYGAVRFCFLAESSGDSALDEQARQFLELCRFKTKSGAPPDSAELIWTTAAILWGNDVATRPSTAPIPAP